MEYIPTKKAKRATRAIYIKEETIANVESMSQEEDMTFSELVNDMIDFCLTNRVKTNKKDKIKAKK